MGTELAVREVWHEKPLIETAPSYERLSLLLGKPQKMTIEKVIKRFLAKVQIPEEGLGCWIWKGAKNPKRLPQVLWIIDDVGVRTTKTTEGLTQSRCYALTTLASGSASGVFSNATKS